MNLNRRIKLRDDERKPALEPSVLAVGIVGFVIWTIAGTIAAAIIRFF